jgi:hypothetical protein
MSENAYTRVARATIRLIAFALIVTSLLLYVDDLMRLVHNVDMQDTQYVVVHVASSKLALKAIPFLIGAILFFTSRPLAERLTKDLD